MSATNKTGNLFGVQKKNSQFLLKLKEKRSYNYHAFSLFLNFLKKCVKLNFF